MKMVDYLFVNNLNAYDLAKICMVSHTVIYKVMDNKPISQKIADKINRKTRSSIDFIIYTPHHKGGGKNEIKN